MAVKVVPAADTAGASVDISGLSYGELRDLKARVEVRMAEMQETGVPALRDRFADEAARLGVTLEQVVRSGTRKRRRPRKRREETGSADNGVGIPELPDGAGGKGANGLAAPSSV